MKLALATIFLTSAMFAQNVPSACPLAKGSDIATATETQLRKAFRDARIVAMVLKERNSNFKGISLDPKTQACVNVSVVIKARVAAAQDAAAKAAAQVRADHKAEGQENAPPQDF